MARLVCIVFIASCFSSIEARKTKNDQKDTLSWARPCEPGKFYPGPQCSKCFCSQSKKRICGPAEVCKLSRGPPNIGEIQRVLAVAAGLQDLEDLPEVAHVSSECEPGLLYRMDCNRCLCLHRKSLTCELNLCPSFDDVNRIKASQLTGKPCQTDTVQGCVECSCKDGKNSCQAKENCGPSSLKGKKKRRCVPGKKYKMKDGSGIKCTCSMDRKLSCGMNNNNTDAAPLQMKDEGGITGNEKPETLDDQAETENEHVISEHGPAIPGIVLLNLKHQKPSHIAEETAEDDTSISKDYVFESAPHIQPVDIQRPKPHHAEKDSETAEDEYISNDYSLEFAPHIQPVDAALLRPKPHYTKKGSGDTSGKN